jgi:hypothetical protein
MNYDLAIMALEGLTRAPMTVRASGSEVVIEADAASFKELARLFLLLGGASTTQQDSFELQPGAHLTKGSPAVKLKLR